MNGWWIVATVVVALAYRLGSRGAWLDGYRDALADVEETDRHVGWVRTMGEPAGEPEPARPKLEAVR